MDALDPSGRVAGSNTTDASGRYAVALPPGQYTLRVDTGSSFPRCPDTAVTVTAGPPVTTDIDCDTGIR